MCTGVTYERKSLSRYLRVFHKVYTQKQIYFVYYTYYIVVIVTIMHIHIMIILSVAPITKAIQQEKRYKIEIEVQNKIISYANDKLAVPSISFYKWLG